MSNVRSRPIRNIARRVMEEYPDRVTTNFGLNKYLLQEVVEGGNKKLLNKVAGYLVVLKKNEKRTIESPHKAIRKMDRM